MFVKIFKPMLENHCMKGVIVLLFMLLHSAVSANTYYVSTTGSNDNYPGTISQPWATWQKAFNSAQAGDTVFFRGGVWYPTSFVVYNGSGPGHSGTYSNPICYFNYPGETPVLDLSHYSYTISAAGLDIRNVTYVKFRGLTIRNNKQRVVNQWIAGLQFYQCGNLWVDQMVEYGSNGYGIWFSGFDTLYLTNCDSYNNLDSLSTERGNRADGFQISAGGSETDTFKYAVITGNRAWNNCDDGMEISISKQFEAYNNWMFNNGKYEYGAGVGFKFGPSNVRTPGKRKFHHNLAAFNKGPAFADQNLTSTHEGPVCEMSNNTSYKCGFGFTSDPNMFNCNAGYGKVIYRNNIVYQSTYSAHFDQIYLTACNYEYPSYSVQDHNTWVPISNSPYWTYNNAVNWSYTDIIADNFTLTDPAQGMAQLMAERKEGGSLPDITFLKLRSTSELIDAGIDVGLGYNGMAPDLGAWECEYQPGTSNLYPTIHFTGPSNGRIFETGSAITITAEAEDADGFISKVEFFAGSEKLGECISAPYLFEWHSPPLGSYILWAVATDNHGAKATSSKIIIRFVPGDVVLYPNPTSGVFKFALKEPLKSNSDIMIVSSEGRIVYKDTMSGEEILKQFDLSYIPSGLYILVLYDENVVETKKIIKR